METAIQKTNNSPLAMASEFIKNDSNVDIDKLAKLLEVQERWEANEAKKAYVAAMTDFKLDPPKIIRDRHVKYQTSKGSTDYRHASLENVTAVISAALSKHGLTASWITGQADNSVTVTCRITHVFGHFEETSLTSAPDTSGSKNPIQAIGSAVTYLQRYTLLALTGLATEGQDDDGQGADKLPKQPEMTLNDEQEEYIDKLTVALVDALDGVLIVRENVKQYCITSAKRTGKAVPEDDKNIGKMVKFLLQKPDDIQYLTGEVG